MMTRTLAHWRCTAAYLYTLHLDGPSLAWEYLRRNPHYGADWQRQRHRRRAAIEHAHRWGLRLFEDPGCDARAVNAAWTPDPDTVLCVQEDDDPPTDAPRFHLWRVPGRKILIHDGRRLVLASFINGRVVRIVIAAGLEDGLPYAYAVHADARLSNRLRLLQGQLALLQASDPRGLRAVNRRPDRMALVHMRSLQAFDGARAGASQRQVAEALFGSDAVAERWYPDSELRAQIRHLIRRGRHFAAGGYRRLLSCAQRQQGDERSPSESP